MAALEPLRASGSLALQAGDCQILMRKFAEQTEQDETGDKYRGRARRQMAEFNVWCAKLGVNEHGHRSIDFRLKDVPQICDAIRLLLQSLKLDLSRLPVGSATAATPARVPETSPAHDDLAAAKRSRPGSNENEGYYGDGGGSDTSSQSFPSLSSPESSADEETWPGQTSVVSPLWRHIEDTIDRLHGLARRVQDAGAKDRQERIERYRRKPGQNQVYDLFLKIATEKLECGEDLKRATAFIKERIATSFARRRMKFAYLESHAARRGVGPPANPSAAPAAVCATSHKRAQAGPDLAPQDSGSGLADPSQLQMMPQAEGATVYTRTENTKLRDTPEMPQPERPESVASATLRHHGFPRPPNIKDKDYFICPYCRLYFPAREALMDRWSYHVIQDFEPYFCIFEQCDAPFDVPNTFEGLLSHMQVAHLPEQWHVETAEGHRIFYDQNDFKSYIEDQGDIPESLLPTMAEFARRSEALVFDRCDFCGGYPDDVEKEFPDPSTPGAQERLRKHIKKHLHDVALFLPPGRDDLAAEEDGNTGSSAGSGAGNQARSKKAACFSDPTRVECGRQSCDLCQDDRADHDLPAALGEATPRRRGKSRSTYQNLGWKELLPHEYPDWDEVMRQLKREDSFDKEWDMIFRLQWRYRQALKTRPKLYRIMAKDGEKT